MCAEVDPALWSRTAVTSLALVRYDVFDRYRISDVGGIATGWLAGIILCALHDPFLNDILLFLAQGIPGGRRHTVSWVCFVDLLPNVTARQITRPYASRLNDAGIVTQIHPVLTGNGVMTTAHCAIRNEYG